jgi:hypothetical protein
MMDMHQRTLFRFGNFLYQVRKVILCQEESESRKEASQRHWGNCHTSPYLGTPVIMTSSITNHCRGVREGYLSSK